jgi:hypothetical protein
MIPQHSLQISISSNNILFHSTHLGFQAKQLFLDSTTSSLFLNEISCSTTCAYRIPTLMRFLLSWIWTSFSNFLLRRGSSRFKLYCIQLGERVVDRVHLVPVKWATHQTLPGLPRARSRILSTGDTNAETWFDIGLKPWIQPRSGWQHQII